LASNCSAQRQVRWPNNPAKHKITDAKGVGTIAMTLTPLAREKGQSTSRLALLRHATALSGSRPEMAKVKLRLRKLIIKWHRRSRRRITGIALCSAHTDRNRRPARARSISAHFHTFLVAVAVVVAVVAAAVVAVVAVAAVVADCCHSYLLATQRGRFGLRRKARASGLRPVLLFGLPDPP
jgi:hypothetical protein